MKRKRLSKSLVTMRSWLKLFQQTVFIQEFVNTGTVIIASGTLRMKLAPRN